MEIRRTLLVALASFLGAALLPAAAHAGTPHPAAASPSADNHDAPPPQTTGSQPTAAEAGPPHQTTGSPLTATQTGPPHQTTGSQPANAQADPPRAETASPPAATEADPPSPFSIGQLIKPDFPHVCPIVGGVSVIGLNPSDPNYGCRDLIGEITCFAVTGNCSPSCDADCNMPCDLRAHGCNPPGDDDCALADDCFPDCDADCPETDVPVPGLDETHHPSDSPWTVAPRDTGRPGPTADSPATDSPTADSPAAGQPRG